MSYIRSHILVCTGTGCSSSDSPKVIEEFEKQLAAQGMDKKQFNMMLMLQVREMLVQGFVLDAWARHYGLEATEDDVLYVANLMSNNRGKLMLDNLREAGEEEQLKGLEMAARRYVANKDLLEKAHITEE